MGGFFKTRFEKINHYIKLKQMYVCFCTFKFKYIICKYSCMFCFEPGSHSVVQANLVYRKQEVFLPLPLNCWGSRCTVASQLSQANILLNCKCTSWFLTFRLPCRLGSAGTHST